MVKLSFLTRSTRNITLFLAALSGVSQAQANAQVPAPPSLAVKAYMVQDFNSGHVIATQNASMRVEPASLTKIMTAYLSLKALKMAICN